MAMNDLLSDMLTRIRNGQRAHLYSVDSYYSKLLEGVCGVLKDEGYITSFEKTGTEAKPMLRIELKYHEGQPVINTLKRISTPGRREYSPVATLKKVNNGLGISILTTSSGIVSDRDARAKNIGGEVLCEVF